MSDGYGAVPLGRFLDGLAAAQPAPSGGAAAAYAVGMGAALAAMAAGFSSAQLADHDEVVARAEELRARVAPLADADAVAYGAVLTAMALPKTDPGRGAAVRDALSRAADVPLAIAEVGAAVVPLAARLEREGNPNLRGDALTGRLLAAAGVRAAAGLVELNLADRADPRLARARALAAETS